MLERLFQLKAHNTNVRTEILAGVTTFLAMAYILFVNPSILGETGMDKGAVFVATCLAAAIGSTVMGLIANYPIALPERLLYLHRGPAHGSQLAGRAGCSVHLGGDVLHSVDLSHP